MLPLKAIVQLCSTLQASAWSLGGARACVAGCTSPITAHSARRAHHTALMQAEPAPMEIKSDETYGLMLKTLMATEENVADQISANYAMVDYNFLQQLDGRLAEGKAEEAARLTAIKDAVAKEMARRMEEATDTLRSILASPSLVVMDGKMAGLVRQGKIDDALLQLLEANLQQARAAGEQGKGAVAALERLQSRVNKELDQKLPEEQALLRRLLRMDSKVARVGLLKEKLSPKTTSKVLVAENMDDKGEEKDLTPDVDPRDLSKALTDLKLRFGNVDENFDTGFIKKVETITEEAEEVALELAGGREITAQEQQDMMWNAQTVSVWDLEAMEDEAEQNNQVPVWSDEGQQIIDDLEARKRAAQQQQQGF